MLAPNTLQYRPEGRENADPRNDPLAQRDAWLAKQVYRVVRDQYPGHFWEIEVSHAQGVVKISIPPLMGATNKYVVYIATLKGDPMFRSVLRMCGEILERYQIPRCRYLEDHFRDAQRRIPIHLRGFHGHIPV